MLLIIVTLLTNSCHNQALRDNIRVHIDQTGLFEKQQKVLVINFMQPDYLGEEGAILAEKSQQTLLASGKFQIIAAKTDFDWARSGSSFEDQLKEVFKIAKDFDYLLIGKIEKFLYGSATSTCVELSIRLIRIKDRLTLYYASLDKEQTARDSKAPLDIQRCTAP